MTDTATLPPPSSPPLGPKSARLFYVEDVFVPTAEGPESHYSLLRIPDTAYGAEHPLVDSSYVVTLDHIDRVLERTKAVLNQYHVNTASNVSSDDSPQSSNPYVMLPAA